MFEEAARQEVHTPIQVFASDLDERSIVRAREGLYPAAIEADVSPERLERFFTREGEYYRVKRELRDVLRQLEELERALRDKELLVLTLGREIKELTVRVERLEEEKREAEKQAMTSLITPIAGRPSLPKIST